ncbi:MAG TPA: hypothetical protein DHU56_17275 [Marinobacter sp.]|uniref:T5orf172 domain-containing protein n=1 Tax=Marinobacter persicus TaxID=930118 RepID=A0A1I3NZW3_9GAMM|nr:GIY-YIG nuclease family protein [Marinobacter persicus]GHD50950.1 hypothetical protein GCM10008110_22210 [Marinobacter persicus]SFJ14858.1 T5orf172 domain-containing protein [Marinobacter persicus]HCW91779.1 hypothetical protein [Marinobacter sp.]
MKFIDLIRMILRDRPEGATPQQIRDQIKADCPDWYGTAAHRRNVDKGHYNNLDHALLAEIYIATRQASDIFADKSTRPMTLTMDPSSSIPGETEVEAEDLIESENLLLLEQGFGTVYVLGTGLFTKLGVEIVKIGITTGDVSARIRQLYTTGVPTKFRVIETFDVQNYAELEQALHKILDPFRINRAREFFTEHCLPFIQKIVKIHIEIQDAKAGSLDCNAEK